jgi:nucleoid-associated protein YgaU
MGIFDSFKNVFGKSESEADATVSPSQMLREAGVDPAGLKFGFGSDGSITVSGAVSDQADHQKVLDTLSGIPGINRVEDQMTVAPPSPFEEPPQEPVAAESELGAAETGAAAPEAQATAAASGLTYTVQSGDTLWKIADEMYGNGSKYMKIFEANSDLLEHPDRIFPGQELSIPDLKD